MNDPVRLLASPDATDFEKELLGSIAGERPSAAARDRTLAMLGLASGAAAATAAGSIAPKAAAGGWALIAKWMALGAVVVGAAAAGSAVVRHRASDATPAATPVAVATTPVAPEPRVTAAPQATFEAPPVVTSQAVARAHVAPLAAPAASTLEQQVAALDRARAALDAGDAARAIRLVDAYEAEYARGAFVQEAEVVRIEALVHEEKTAEAEHAAKRFLATYPNSPHDARVRSLAGSSK